MPSNQARGVYRHGEPVTERPIHGDRIPTHGVAPRTTRTNQARNTPFAGGAAGVAPVPHVVTLGLIGGVTTSLAYGSENGLPYVDWIFAGQNTSGGLQAPVYRFMGNGDVTVVPGDDWVVSASVKLLAGALGAGTTVDMALREGDAAAVQQALTGTNFVPNGADQRVNHTRVMGGTTFRLAGQVRVTIPNLDLTNFTLRIKCPQLELGTAPSEFIINASQSAGTSQNDVGAPGFES